jgi:lysine biosynthesis protein LysW
MAMRTRTTVASCLECGQAIDLKSQPKEGQRITCPECGAFLEIINLEPLEFDWAFSEFEPDWESDEDQWEGEEWEEEEWDDEESIE